MRHLLVVCKSYSPARLRRRATRCCAVGGGASAATVRKRARWVPKRKLFGARFSAAAGSAHRLEIGEEPRPGGGLERPLGIGGAGGGRQETGRGSGLALRVDGVGPGLAAVLGQIEVVAEPWGV